jgi:hypothetical protein
VATPSQKKAADTCGAVFSLDYISSMIEKQPRWRFNLQKDYTKIKRIKLSLSNMNYEKILSSFSGALGEDILFALQASDC